MKASGKVLRFFERRLWLFLLLSALLNACGLKKELSTESPLVHKINVKGSPRQFKEDLIGLSLQKPNKRILGLVKFHMWGYLNRQRLRRLGKNKKKKKGKQGQIWEEPVYLDSSKTAESAERMTVFLNNKGYFNADVDYSVKRKGKYKSVVTYKVNAKKPYTLADIELFADDREIQFLLSNWQSITGLAVGEAMDANKLAEARDLLTFEVRKNGYYDFTKDFVFFELDTALASHRISADIKIVSPGLYQAHQKFNVRKVFIQPEYSISQTGLDTVDRGEGYFNIGDTSRLSPALIIDYMAIGPNKLFNAEDYQQTLKSINGLSLFKYLDIEFAEDMDDSLSLDCYVRLSRYDRFDVSMQLEVNTTDQNIQATNTFSRLYGLANTLSFSDKNFLGKGIQWETSLRFAFDVSPKESDLIFANYEYGANTSLYFHKPFLPGLQNTWLARELDKTALTLSFLRENNIDFRRSTGSAGLVYQVNNNLNKHYFTPMEISLVKTDPVSDAFRELLDSTDNDFLKNLFDNHVIVAGRWTVIYDEQFTKRTGNYWQIRMNVIELAGNSMRLLSQFWGIEPAESDKQTFDSKLFGINFFQYVKGDYDIKFNHRTRYGNLTVYRFFGGLIYPFGNTSETVPFEKRYFAGGANDIRAWGLRRLGPGSVSSDDSQNLSFNQSGDVKLELNVEHRFDLFSFLEAALFVDAGNIWNLPDNRSTLVDGDFSFDRFHKEIAVGGGIGTRFNFNYFILRLDFAIPMRDPALLSQGETWFPDDVYNSKWFEDIRIHFGIGYPF